MTGRELIIYILENHLEEKDLFADGQVVGFMSEVEACAKFGVGRTTLQIWRSKGLLPFIRIGEAIYIPKSAVNPKELITSAEKR